MEESFDGVWVVAMEKEGVGGWLGAGEALFVELRLECKKVEKDSEGVKEVVVSGSYFSLLLDVPETGEGSGVRILFDRSVNCEETSGLRTTVK